MILYEYATDKEIKDFCIKICKEKGNKEDSVSAIKEWCGYTPSIAFTHHGRDFMFMGMIFSPSGDTISF